METKLLTSLWKVCICRCDDQETKAAQGNVKLSIDVNQSDKSSRLHSDPYQCHCQCHSRSRTEMKGPRLALIALMYVLLFCQKIIYGEEVEMKVRPGDNITLYCDRSLTLGSYIVWIRNCSHENQPSLIIDYEKLTKKIFPRFSFIQNSYSNSFDLHITNISVSDLGLYYCAKLDNNITKDSKGIVYSLKVYYYGNQITRLSLKVDQVSSCSGALNTTSTPPPVSDCLLCWMLLFSVCLACFLFSSICVYCLCCKKTTDAATDQKNRLSGRNTAECTDEEVCYASLDVITKRQKQRKTKRVQSSDFSTYAQHRLFTRLTEMERPRLALLILMLLLFHQKRIYGEEVEMKVRPGDNVTLYCDRSITISSSIVWIRNCSHENQPSLIIDLRKLDLKIFPHFKFIHNLYNNSHDLHITNISVSDLGLYYCAEEQNVNKKDTLSTSEVYYYGKRTTRLSLETHPDCLLCWRLFSVCPLCVLLSSVCLLWLFFRKPTDSATDQKDKLKTRNTVEGNDNGVCYTSVDMMTWRQKRHKKTHMENSDFTTYAPVRTETE
ncbi:hypothetical protein QQF64_001403 [Cirrhinus molitorella]|uniref:Ig-like domain-containing protein n=1 Tax=Cirrhinus molitorella TaxID=172907 RepID=A0ABR3NZZ0_9TELE